jgi:hypothetical protein
MVGPNPMMSGIADALGLGAAGAMRSVWAFYRQAGSVRTRQPICVCSVAMP